MNCKIWLTMKTIYLLRHAKSSWDNQALSDFDRPLNERGQRAAPFIGALMKERGLLPEAIFSSPALRAKTTSELVASAAGIETPIIFDDRIYAASPMRLLTLIRAIGDDIASAMIVGHNPGMEGFLWYLTGKLEPMPTATLAASELDVAKWADVTERCGNLTEIIRPKELMK